MPPPQPPGPPIQAPAVSHSLPHANTHTLEHPNAHTPDGGWVAVLEDGAVDGAPRLAVLEAAQLGPADAGAVLRQRAGGRAIAGRRWQGRAAVAGSAVASGGGVRGWRHAEHSSSGMGLAQAVQGRGQHGTAPLGTGQAGRHETGLTGADMNHQMKPAAVTAPT